MPPFTYTARDEAGNPVSGTLSAESLTEASRILRAEGKYPLSIRPASSGSSASTVGHRGIKVSRSEVVQLSTQLAIMIETGVTLPDALDCIIAQADSPRLKALAEDLCNQVKSGGDFSSALARHPRSFPRLYVALIKASEKSGMMGKLLHRATAYLRDEQETIRKVRGALTYPAIMLSFAVITTLFLLMFVMPRFTVIYSSKGAALPLPTQILMSASEMVTTHWMPLLSGAITLGVLIYFQFQTQSGRRALHYVQIHLPLIGSMFRKLYLARGIRMIGTMAGAGVNLVECVTVTNELTDNSYFRELWNDVLRKIQDGKQMSEPLSNSPLVPRSVAQMIHSGEKSGKLAQVMEQVACFSEQELKDKISELTRYIEPAMIVVMGLLIGGVALALMLPIFTISRVVAT